MRSLLIGTPPELDADLTRLNLAIDSCRFDDVIISYINGNLWIGTKRLDISTYDRVWLYAGWRDGLIVASIELFLQSIGVDTRITLRTESKLSDYMRLALTKTNIPNMFFCKQKLLPSMYQEVIDTCGNPFVIKDIQGVCGQHVYLITSKEEFINLVTTLSNEDYMVCQQFIPNDSDYRIVISDNEVIAATRKYRTNDVFRNNAALGAKKKYLDPNKLCDELAVMAIAIASELRLDWAGVDIVKDPKGKLYFLEANRNPGVTDLEKIMGCENADKSETVVMKEYFIRQYGITP